MEPIPSPFLLMKQSKRVLDFDTEGRPLHPLLDRDVPIRFQPKSTLAWGANFTVNILVTTKDGQALFVKSPNGTWVLPGAAVKDTKNAEKQAISLLKAYIGLPHDHPRLIYSNMDNFSPNTTKYSWVESWVYRYTIPTAIASKMANATWFPLSKLPTSTHPLHKLLASKP